MHYDVSAKSGNNINSLFKFLAGMVSGNEQSILLYNNSLNMSSVNLGICLNIFFVIMNEIILSGKSEKKRASALKLNTEEKKNKLKLCC